MEMFADKYRALYGRITDPVVPGEKADDYYRDKVRYYYTQYSHEGGTLMSAASNFGVSRRTVRDLRDYGRALQDVGKYLREIGYKDREIAKFRTENISYQPAPTWPRFRNQIISKFLDLNLTASTFALDERANIERLTKVNQFKITRQAETQSVVPSLLPSDDLPKNLDLQDIDYLLQIGEIQLDFEVMAKDALDMTFYKSRLPTLQKMWLEDFVDLGGVACDTYLVNNTQKVDYVDYARVIIRSSIYPDYRDSDVRGYTSQKKVSELLMIDEDSIRPHLGKLKESYAGMQSADPNYYYNNQGFREDYTTNASLNGNYYDFGVTVCRFYWLDTEVQRFVVGQHSRGSRIFERVADDFELSERGIRAGKRVEEYPIQFMYRCSWIVGTDIIFDYGKADIIARPGQNGAKELVWPMQVYTATEPSLTEKVIPFIDDIQIALFKKRTLIAKIPPAPRMLIYKDKLRETLRVGDETYTIRELMKMYQREGILLLERSSEYTLPGDIPANKNEVIEFIESGIAEDVAIIENTIAISLQRIQEATGMNPIVDGTAAQTDMLKSVVESLKLSANSALRPWLESYAEFYKILASTLIWRYQIIAALGDSVLGTLPISGGLSKIVRIGPGLLKYDLGVGVRINDAQYFEFLMQDLMSKRELLPPESYFMIFNALNDKDLRKAEYYLIRFTRAAKEEAHQQQMQLVQAQAQSNAEAGVSVERERQKAEIVKIEKELAKMREEFALAEVKSQKDHGRKIEEIQLTEALKKDTSVATVRENRSKEVPNALFEDED